MSCPGSFDPPPTIPTVVFGNRAGFAVEAGIEPDKHTDRTLWGRMCVWCRGVMLGDLDEPCCGIGFAAEMFAELQSEVGTLWADEFAGLDDTAAWNFLDGLLYGFHGDIEVPDDRTSEEIGRDHHIWSRFDFLTNWGEQFDGFKSFLLCPPPGDTIRVLYRGPDGLVGRGLSVSRAGFVNAAEGFIRWFRGEEQRLLRL